MQTERKSGSIGKLNTEVANLERQFGRKILTIDQVLELVGPRPDGHSRDKPVIMAHGTFDNVHAGHLRQLVFAKNHASTLVVSLTCDEHISKGDLRPWVPEELRALHLAALELVDYVVIDINPTPLENISKLKPDFFVKGFEYARNGVHPKTQQEINILESFGGKMLFSPDDIVYSSSKILAHERPRLAKERVALVMESEGIGFGDLRRTVEKIRGVEIEVLGDLIVDRYTYCIGQTGQSQEEDVQSYLFTESEDFVGGAGVVAKHLASLGAAVTLTALVGDDDSAEFALGDLNKAGVKLNVVRDETRSTTVKERFVNRRTGRTLYRLNRLENGSISDELLGKLCKHLIGSHASAVVCSDFRHGIFNRRTIPSIVESIPRGLLKVADSQVSTRWGNILEFQGFDILCPNEREARWSLGDQDTPLRPMAQELYRRADCKYLLLKLGEEGLLTYRSPGKEHREFFYLESFATDVIDPVGAGDALLAMATSAYAASGSIVQASILGSLCASLECARMGNVPVSSDDLNVAIGQLEEGK